jgi:IgA Peptidase M64
MNRRIFLRLVFMTFAPLVARAEVPVQVQPTGLTYTAILVNGSATSKFDIVFIGDGFRKEDQTAFNNKVNEAVAALQNRPGYSARMCGFNIWRVNVLSTDSGIDHPKNGISKNTALDCRYGNPAMLEAERCIVTDSPAKCFEAAANAPARDAVFVLVNDTQWGGCAGDVVCSSIAAGFDGLITHELAHDVGELADEYDCYVCDGSDSNRTYSGNDPAEVNITNNTDRATTKWRDLINATTAIPTTSDTPPGVVGLWEGGGYYRNAMFRPQNNCHMRQTADPFCAVCARKLDGVLTIRCLAVLDVLKYRRFIWREPLRIPIPICLSCPLPPEGDLLDRVTLQLAGLPRDATVRIVDSQGNVVAQAQPSGEGFNVDFQSSHAERYFAELIPAQSMTPQEVTLRTELFRNGEAQELPVIGQH